MPRALRSVRTMPESCVGDNSEVIAVGWRREPKQGSLAAQHLIPTDNENVAQTKYIHVIRTLTASVPDPNVRTFVVVIARQADPRALKQRAQQV